MSDSAFRERKPAGVRPLDGGELAARWWKWALSAPAESCPVRDTTGRHAQWRQPSDVWFLAGTYGGRVVRRCQIPSGRPVFFPVINSARSALGLSGRPIQVAVSSAAADLNGVPLEMYEYSTRRFWAVGRPRVAWGLWSALSPLTPGQYVLTIRATSGTFLVDTTYHLDVVPTL
ncbi:hypothetical protein CFP65_5910 [Kitasatospora sp. MMS16-BH015]|uniref:hypothetical protein n=1 Tax=Kitasatospora sp. MMS16-BH015 TaxID=2018025 RepID=UPI000CA187D9|nr:hypothetical protein [Kitasatospora sp. MMS16-BH015]AUG80589.1 hypothetical protein CFP65_5910 [Kitasatospora sp. MMS16-BH015]